MTSALVWEDPPDRYARAVRNWQKIVAELKAHPGKWAVIAEFPVRSKADSLGVTIRSGRAIAWRPAGSFDAQVHAHGDTFRIYVKYSGDQP
jgi:hypothetical protein